MQGAAQVCGQGLAEDLKTDIVLVWDLDETLIIFHSLLNGAWAAAHGSQVPSLQTPTIINNTDVTETSEENLQCLCHQRLGFITSALARCRPTGQ